MDYFLGMVIATAIAIMVSVICCYIVHWAILWHDNKRRAKRWIEIDKAMEAAYLRTKTKGAR